MQKPGLFHLQARNKSVTIARIFIHIWDKYSQIFTSFEESHASQRFMFYLNFCAFNQLCLLSSFLLVSTQEVSLLTKTVSHDFLQNLAFQTLPISLTSSISPFLCVLFMCFMSYSYKYAQVSQILKRAFHKHLLSTIVLFIFHSQQNTLKK